MKNHTKLWIGLLISVLAPIAGAACLSGDDNPPGAPLALPPALISDGQTPLSIQNLAQSAQNDLYTLRSKLKDNSPFLGLYVSGEAAQRMSPNGGNQTYLGLDWEVFRRGYFAGQRSTELGNAEALIDAYTMLQNLRNQAQDQAQHNAKLMQNAVMANLYEQEVSRQEKLTSLYRTRMQAGYATREAYDKEVSDLKRDRRMLDLYNGQPKIFIPTEAASLIDNIDNLQLAPLSTLENKALIHSGIREMKRLHEREATLTTPQWTDNLRLDVYARRIHDFTGYGGNQVGVLANVPIGGNPESSDIEQIRTRLQDLQLTADEARLDEKLSSLHDQFRYSQTLVKILQNVYRLSLAQADLECEQSRLTVPTLDSTPEKSAEDISISLIEQQRDILVARLNAYDLFLQLQTTIQPLPEENWYSIQ